MDEQQKQDGWSAYDRHRTSQKCLQRPTDKQAGQEALQAVVWAPNGVCQPTVHPA